MKKLIPLLVAAALTGAAFAQGTTDTPAPAAPTMKKKMMKKKAPKKMKAAAKAAPAATNP